MFNYQQKNNGKNEYTEIRNGDMRNDDLWGC